LPPAQQATRETEFPQPEFAQAKKGTKQRDKQNKKHHLELQVLEHLKGLLVYVNG
jgi:hypothetical protein